jgi:hypothetical protein
LLSVDVVLHRGSALSVFFAVCGVAGRAEADEAEPPALRLALGEACPDRAAFEGALVAEGLRVGDDAAVALRLSVHSRGGGVAVELADSQGRVLFERVLPAGDCGALADAVALLVGRHLQGVEGDVALPAEEPAPDAAPALVPSEPAARLETEAPAPHPESWSFEGRGGVLVSTALRPVDASVGPFAGLRLASGLFSSAVSAGWMRSEVPVADEGALVVDRIPVALGLGARFARRGVDLGVHATVEAEFLHIESDLAGAATETRAAWRLGPVLSLGLEPVPRLRVGVDVGALARLWGYRFVVDGLGDVGGQAPIALEGMVSLGWRGGA